VDALLRFGSHFICIYNIWSIKNKYWWYFSMCCVGKKENI
jgi:hypothetical protein